MKATALLFQVFVTAVICSANQLNFQSDRSSTSIMPASSITDLLIITPGISIYGSYFRDTTLASKSLTTNPSSHHPCIFIPNDQAILQLERKPHSGKGAIEGRMTVENEETNREYLNQWVYIIPIHTRLRN